MISSTNQINQVCSIRRCVGFGNSPWWANFKERWLLLRGQWRWFCQSRVLLGYLLWHLGVHHFGNWQLGHCLQMPLIAAHSAVRCLHLVSLVDWVCLSNGSWIYPSFVMCLFVVSPALAGPHQVPSVEKLHGGEQSLLCSIAWNTWNTAFTTALVALM